MAAVSLDLDRVKAWLPQYVRSRLMSHPTFQSWAAMPLALEHKRFGLRASVDAANELFIIQFAVYPDQIENCVVVRVTFAAMQISNRVQMTDELCQLQSEFSLLWPYHVETPDDL